MIPCKHCNTQNSLDSTFCKRCGTGIPEDELREAREKLEKIIEEGVHALNLGKVEEAMAIAENATASDPSSVPALSLKASCHERRGEIVEALESAERIVELNPSSDLDKIKRNQLRTALSASAMRNREPSKGVALVAAVCAALIVVCLPLAISRVMQKAPTNSRVASNDPAYVPTSLQNTTQRLNPDPNVTAPTQQTQTSPSGAGQQQVNPPDANTYANQIPPDPGLIDEGGAPAKSSTGKTLPPIDETGITVAPINPGPPPTTIDTTKTKPVVKDPSGDPPPGPETTATKDVTPSTAPVGDGVIAITVHGPGTRRIGNGGSQPVDPGAVSGDSARPYVRAGDDQFQIGNYSGAASFLEQALKHGGDPAQVNYRLSQAYATLGRKSDAASAYQSCIQACDAALASGRGNATRLRAMKDTCQTALRQIQGG